MRQGVERAAHPISRFAWRVERAVRAYGVTGAAQRGWGALRSVRAERRNGDRDPFDDEMGVTTARDRPARVALRARPKDARPGHPLPAVRPGGRCGRTIAELSIRYEEFAFVDFGSGKGRALLVAAEYPFERIVGIEFAEELHEIAQRQPRRRTRIQRSVVAAIEAICADATAYELPATAARSLLLQPVLRARHAAGDGQRRPPRSRQSPGRLRRAVAEHTARADRRGGRVPYAATTWQRPTTRSSRRAV